MDTEEDLLKQQEDIFEQLKQFISEIIGADVVEELSITKNSTFTKDLEMDSIEIVTFAKKVKTYYGENIDFINWLYTMDLNTLINLSMESVIHFISDAVNTNRK